MSSLSSPATSTSSNIADDAPIPLTPSKKVQALLAQFEESDSERELESNRQLSQKKLAPQVLSSNQTSEDEAEDAVQPRGRLATRLLGGSDNIKSARNSDGVTFATISRPAAEKEVISTVGETTNKGHTNSSSDEDANTFPARRRLLINRRSNRQYEAQSASRESRSPSPLFFPSPSAEDQSPSSPSRQQTKATLFPSPANDTGPSKFLALVERHRRERLAREAAEAAKRAAGAVESEHNGPRGARGSSPADDSDESDASADKNAVARIQKEARPTRKASKKALEEMNRETQRMSRNMQLAHQARTKKRITKESLLARFGFTFQAAEDREHLPIKSSTASSSTVASDAESRNGHQTTPPTSPAHGTDSEAPLSKEPEVEDITHLPSTEQVTTEMHGALAPEEEQELPAIKDPLAGDALSIGMRKVFQYKQHDTTVKSPRPEKTFTSDAVPGINNTKVPKASDMGRKSFRCAHMKFAEQAHSDSDGEIEIVKDRGSKRKYAAFETLPKRKAQEMPSHLALRSLAHIIGNEDKKRSMNAAELEASLRRKARLQALDERRQKIEHLKAKGVVIQTAEERERDQQEVEDLVERARQEAMEIQKREKDAAKKDGTYVKDNLDDDEDENSEDADFEEELEGSQGSSSEDDDDDENVENGSNDEADIEVNLVDSEVEESKSGEGTEASEDEEAAHAAFDPEATDEPERPQQLRRNVRVVVDDDDEDEELGLDDQILSPQLPPPAKTPQSVPRSARRIIPGLQTSDDLPMGLSQAFAATMAESQTQEQDSLDVIADLPSLGFAKVPPLQRLDSLDIIGDSQPSASQTQPLNVNLLSQSQIVPDSPRGLGLCGAQYTPSQHQIPFELTQDNGYILSPFTGNRFSETPRLDGPHSTVETVIVPQGVEDSPVIQRRGRLQRGRADTDRIDDNHGAQSMTAFELMQKAAKNKGTEEQFNKKKSEARNIIDEAAEESEDEYAGLGGASDDSGDDEENEEDRQMIDEDTQVGQGDEAKLAGLYADRERERDEKEVSKLLKDITTGALRRKRGGDDDLDLSDEEDAAARRREAKRREFARMRRELLKDEAVGKIAEDKRKEAFLRSIEDHEAEDDEEELDHPADAEGVDSQSQDVLIADSQGDSQAGQKRKRPLDTATEDKLNRLPPALRRSNPNLNRRPATLAEIRDSVSFLIEEPNSQAAMVDLGLSDSEDEPEAYVDLDRHFREAEADENDLDDDHEDLGDFIVDDGLPGKGVSQHDLFKKPELPRQERAPFTERRTKHIDVVDRLSLLRQASSSASSTASHTSASSKMAFFSSKTGVSFSGVPTLLRRATTNSSFGSTSGRDNVSATGVVTSKTERGSAGEEKEFVRKGNGGRRNAVNYQGERKTLREEKMDARAGAMKAGKGKKGHGFLGGLFRGDSWE